MGRVEGTNSRELAPLKLRFGEPNSGETTVWSDLAIAEHYGRNLEDVRDTVRDIDRNLRHDIRLITEASMLINWRCWFHSDIANSGVEPTTGEPLAPEQIEVAQQLSQLYAEEWRALQERITGGIDEEGNSLYDGYATNRGELLYYYREVD